MTTGEVIAFAALIVNLVFVTYTITKKKYTASLGNCGLFLKLNIPG